MALTILGVVLLGFVGHLAVVSNLRYQRAQITSYADFRVDLGNATAPTGQTDSDGRLLALGTPVAVVRIPALDLHAVVFEGTTSGVLEMGPGHRRDTVLPGQAGSSVIMGRRAMYGGPFARLDELVTGDRITTITGQGEHEYRVVGVRRAGDPVVPAEDGVAGRLTLATADGDLLVPDDVIRVDADLVGPAEPTPRKVLSPQAMSPGEQANRSDPDAWVGVMLWGQALALAVLAVTWMRIRWGLWQAWIVGVPVLGALGMATADQLAGLFPNLM